MEMAENVPSHKDCEEDPFFGIRIALRVTANSRRRGIGGGEMSRTRGQNFCRPPRSCRPHGRLLGCREGGRTFSSDNCSGPFGTLPRSRPPPSLTLYCTPSRRAPRHASGQRPLTDILAPCAGGRATFSKVIDYKAFAPGDELQLGVQYLLQPSFEPPGSGLTWRLRTRKSASCSARRDACDG